MCCGIYLNGICLNAWDLVKIEAGMLGFFFLWSLCNSPGCAGVGLLLLLFWGFFGRRGELAAKTLLRALRLKDLAPPSLAPAADPANSLHQQSCFS